jgi:hypothetical protein
MSFLVVFFLSSFTEYKMNTIWYEADKCIGLSDEYYSKLTKLAILSSIAWFTLVIEFTIRLVKCDCCNNLPRMLKF